MKSRRHLVLAKDYISHRIVSTVSGRAGPLLLLLFLVFAAFSGFATGPTVAPLVGIKLYPSPLVDKHLFLHYDGVNSFLDRVDIMNTSGIRNAALPDYDGDLLPGVTLTRLSESRSFFGFAANPSGRFALAKDFHIWNATALLYMAAQSGGAYQINVSLMEVQWSPFTLRLLGYVNKSVLLQDFAVRVPFVLPTIDAAIPSMATLYLNVSRWDADSKLVFLAYDANDFESRLVVRTDTYVHIDAPSGVFVSGSPRTTFSDWEPYTIAVNVSDPFGAPHIEKASIEVIAPGSVRVAGSGNLSVPNATDPGSVPAWKRFNFTFPPLEQPGTYEVRVNATDIDRLVPSHLRVPQNWNTSYTFTFEVYVLLDHFVVAAPGSVEAGAAFAMTVEARSRAGYFVPNWTGFVAFSAVPPVNEPAGTLSVLQSVVLNGTLTLTSQSYTRAHIFRIEARNASAAGLSGPIQVSPGKPAALTIVQSSPYATTAGLTETFLATAQDALGNPNTTWTAVWTGTGASATITSGGVLAAQVAGSGTVTVRPQGISGVQATIAITVLPAPVLTITLSPVGPVVGLVAGTNQTFIAEGQDAFGNLNLTWQANWSLDDTSMAALSPVDHAGIVTPQKVGSTTLRVASGAVGASVGITIAPGPIASIQVTPAGPLLLDAGENRTFVATVYDAYGNTITAWTPSWQVNGSVGQLVGTGPVVLFIAGQGPLGGSIIVSTNGVQAEVLMVISGEVAAQKPPWALLGGIAAAVAAAGGGAFFWLRRKARTIIDEVFLMTPSGLLIKHFTRRLRPDMDESILAGMLTAVQDFVKDSFRESGSEVDEIKFKDFRIMIGRSPHVLLAAVVSGERTDVLQARLNRVVRSVEEKYGARIAAWSGDLAELAGTETIVTELFAK